MATDKRTGQLRMESWPLSKLKPAAYNPRVQLKPKDEEYQKILRSINELGYSSPIIVNSDGTVISGHQRLAVMKDLGYTEASVVVLELDKQKEKALNVALNKIDGRWDEKKLGDLLLDLDLNSYDFTVTGFTRAEADDLLKGLKLDEDDIQADESFDGSAAYEEIAEPVTKLGDIWILGKHRLMCGDCTDKEAVLQLFGSGQPECILTDPPYCSGGFQESDRGTGSIGTVRKDGKLPTIKRDTMSTRGYITMIKSMIDAARETKCAYVFTDWRMWVNLFDAAESKGFGVRSMIVWDKGTPGMGLGWRSQHELCMFAVRGKAAFDVHGEGSGNVLKETRSGNQLHPTQKPVELIRKIVRVTNFCRTFYDPFLGSGTTLIACEICGRPCYAMELDPKYCDVAVRRWEEYTGEKAELVRREAPDA